MQGLNSFKLTKNFSNNSFYFVTKGILILMDYKIKQFIYLPHNQRNQKSFIKIKIQNYSNQYNLQDTERVPKSFGFRTVTK